jgi:hypothetical protein
MDRIVKTFLIVSAAYLLGDPAPVLAGQDLRGLGGRVQDELSAEEPTRLPAELQAPIDIPVWPRRG